MPEETKIVEAIILAGGLGTRLRSEIGEFPKPLAPTGGVPFLKILLNYLYLNGIERVILAVGYKWELIEAEFGANYKGIDLIYSIENTPLGTGGAIKLALEKTDEEAIFVVNGETLFTAPLQEMRLAHSRKESDCSLALHFMDQNSRYGNVVIDHHTQIQDFKEKGASGSGYINGGIYILNKSALAYFPLGQTFSFETDFLAKKTNELNLFGHPFTTYFKDIGIPEDYHQFEKDLKEAPLNHLL